MATPKQQFAKFNREMKKILDQATTSKEMRKISDTAVEIIVKRTQDGGQGVKTNGSRKVKIKTVTSAYAQYREGIRKGLNNNSNKKAKNRRARTIREFSDKAATGRESNLTFTGKMLSTLKTIKATKARAVMGWTLKKNREKAGFQEAQGRTFLNLANSEVKELSKMLSLKIKKLAKKV